MSETAAINIKDFVAMAKAAVVDRDEMMFWWVPDFGPDVMTLTPSMSYDTKSPTAVITVDNTAVQMAVTPHYKILGLRSETTVIKEFEQCLHRELEGLEGCGVETTLLHFGLRGARSSISYQRNGQPSWAYGVEENILLQFNFGAETHDENPDEDTIFIEHQGGGIYVHCVDEKLRDSKWSFLAYSLLPFAWKDIVWERRCQSKQ